MSVTGDVQEITLFVPAGTPLGMFMQEYERVHSVDLYDLRLMALEWVTELPHSNGHEEAT